MHTSLARAWKPWFVYRPAQILRRLAPLPSDTGFTPMHTAWGASLLVHPGREIGRSLHATGVFDLAVSEAIARLLPRGGTMVDAGANVGYMSVLAATVAGPTGAVLAFEPHPDLVAILRQNTANAGQAAAGAPITVAATALGERTGTALLQLPDAFAGNDGLARVITSVPAGTAVRGDVTAAAPCIPVPVTTLDRVLGDRPVDLLKLDVEGFEAQVLAGAARALSARRIRHIVFEDHDAAGSAAVAILQDAGYELFALGWTLRRLRLEPFSGRPASHAYEAPNYLATRDAAAVREACAPAGWQVLRALAR